MKVQRGQKSKNCLIGEPLASDACLLSGSSKTCSDGNPKVDHSALPSATKSSNRTHNSHRADLEGSNSTEVSYRDLLSSLSTIVFRGAFNLGLVGLFLSSQQAVL